MYIGWGLMALCQSRFLVRSNHNHLWSSQARRDVLEDSEGSRNRRVAGEQMWTKGRAQRAQESQPGECCRHSLIQGPLTTHSRGSPRKTLCATRACPLSRQKETRGKNVTSLGFGSDGGHGKQMLVSPFLTMGSFPQKGNQDSEVGVSTN